MEEHDRRGFGASTSEAAWNAGALGMRTAHVEARALREAAASRELDNAIRAFHRTFGVPRALLNALGVK